jgi:glucose/arabinose dehydrogenase
MLRIDPSVDNFPADADNNYAPSSDNFWSGSSSVRNEILAFGMRNPYRFWVDSNTNLLLIADVGQDRFEEIDAMPLRTPPLSSAPAKNFGWKLREGFGGSGNSGAQFGSNLDDPVLEYGRSVGQSITGGFVYRGTNFPSLNNKFLFGDLLSNKLWAVPIVQRTDNEVLPQAMAQTTEFTPTEGVSFTSSIEPDFKGEIVITEYISGRVRRIVPKVAL